MRHIRLLYLLPLLSLILTACGGESQQEKGEAEEKAKTKETDKKVNVYSHRHYNVDEQLFEAFTEKTGIEVNVVNASADELIKKLEMEGENSPADVLITVDAGRLYRAKDKGLLQPVKSEKLNQNIPQRFRDPEDEWYGLTYRARIIAYHEDRVEKGAIQTYEGLADDKWEDRVLIRSSENIYNQSLMASLIAHKGEEATKKWAKGLVENMARKPQGGDRDQVKAVAAGKGDLAVVNTYYLGHLLNSENESAVKAGEQVKICFPNQDGRGTHVNVSGAGVTKHAPHKESAIRFLEYLSSEKAQSEFAAANYEYPVKKGVKKASVLSEWGDFKKDTLNLNRLGELNRKAVKIADEVGWK